MPMSKEEAEAEIRRLERENEALAALKAQTEAENKRMMDDAESAEAAAEAAAEAEIRRLERETEGLKMLTAQHRRQDAGEGARGLQRRLLERPGGLRMDHPLRRAGLPK